MTLKEFSEKVGIDPINVFDDVYLEKNADKKVIPLKSDPTKADSDGDGFMDGITGEHENTGYYTDIADKWPLSTSPSPEFYQNDGNYYFNPIVLPITYVAGDFSSSKHLSLTEDEQKYIYDLSVIANKDDKLIIDPLLVMGIVAHETNALPLINYWGFTGYMQVAPGHIYAYSPGGAILYWPR